MTVSSMLIMKSRLISPLRLWMVSPFTKGVGIRGSVGDGDGRRGFPTTGGQ